MRATVAVPWTGTARLPGPTWVGGGDEEGETAMERQARLADGEGLMWGDVAAARWEALGAPDFALFTSCSCSIPTIRRPQPWARTTRPPYSIPDGWSEHAPIPHRNSGALRVLRGLRRKLREEDRECYRMHKLSPLVEVELVDTRKPIARATDGGGGDAEVPSPRTVDDSLARAEAMFREATSRGNPEWPHSRALAEMLARRHHQQMDGGAGTRSCTPWGWGS
nr:unnamed protein product [Digitaria exilis]